MWLDAVVCFTFIYDVLKSVDRVDEGRNLLLDCENDLGGNGIATDNVLVFDWNMYIMLVVAGQGLKQHTIAC